MHIPDGLLSTPVWLGLDALGLPAVGWLARRAQRDTREAGVPLLGVMGAFVFAAQMINFPVAPGASGHLIGSGLLTVTLGPAPAAVVMTAVLALQALIFQDGGILALGANVFNMALAGVLVAHLCYRHFGGGRFRSAAVFLGAALSVFVAAALALTELLLSGLAIPRTPLVVALGLFALTAAVEGGLTVAVVGALEKLNPGWVRAPQAAARPALAAVLLAALVLATGGALLASSHPDSLERLIEQVGLGDRTRQWIASPLADYRLPLVDSPWLAQAAAGLAGVVAVLAAGALLGWWFRKRRA
jgi:cobalt/nickel transport system permease protein